MKRYSLENKETSPLIKILQIIFGVACLIVAGWWVVYMVSSGENSGYWLATIFMLAFGAFQIYSGLGYAEKYIVFDDGTIIMKKAALVRKTTLASSDIRKIEILPLSVRMTRKDNQIVTLSFVLSIADTIDHVKDAFIEFAEKNNIDSEEKSDS